jgi:nicotinamide-nucleotide amidase
MRAEVIAIGDELTSGQWLDTNSQWVSERLNELGVHVAFHTTVGDDLDDNITVFRNAIQRADIVVATGGLGPTADDLTRDAIAAATGVELVQDDAALEHIKNLFARRKRAMPERNVVQAQFPRGSRVVPNPHGTAPGIDLALPLPPGEGRGEGALPTATSAAPSSADHCRIFALPGVPAEMFEMWAATVAPAIASMFATPRVIRHHRINCFGVGESDLEAMLPDMIRRKREPLVGITVSGATITLRITDSGENDAACREAMAPTIAEIRDTLGVLVFGEENDELEHAVVRLLNERNQSVAVAEWATDGLVSLWLAEAAGSSPSFHGGIEIRSAESLTSLLDVNLNNVGLDSAECAAAMATKVREKLGSHYGLGIAAFPTTGRQSPTAAASHASTELTGTLHVALATSDNVRTKAFPLATHPSITKTRSAKYALNMLRLALLNTD